MDRVEVKPEVPGPMAPGVEMPAENTQPQQTETAPAERPAWLPEGFESPEQLAEAYKALQSKPAEEPAATAEDTAAQEKLQKYSEEFFEKGTLSDQSYADLAKMGYPRQVVDQFIAGQKAMVSAEEQRVFSEVGGRDNYGKMIEWAAQNLPQEEIAAYNTTLESGDINQVMMAARGLQARYSAAAGKPEPKLIGGSGKTAPSGFNSVAQVVQAMSDPRYKTDPAYRAEVAQKIASSNVL